MNAGVGHVLVLDDDELVGATIGMVAEDAGYGVTTTSHFDAFWTALQEDDPSHVVVEEVATLLRASLPQGVALRTELGARHADVVADAGEIHQILMNLCTNAVRAVRSRGGTLTVATRADPSEGAAQMEVRDDGEGIPADLLERVFDPYVTTHGSGDGTGLGLAIVQHLVESLGGEISLSSTVGQGTVATVRLPLAASSPGAAAPASDDYARSA